MTPSASKRTAAAAAAAAQRPLDPSERAIQQASTAVEEQPRAASVSSPQPGFFARRLQDMERAADIAQARLVSSQRPVMLTTDEVLAMVCHYRHNIRARGMEHESLRNTLAVLSMKRSQPECIPRLLQDIQEGHTQQIAQEWTSDENLDDFLQVLQAEYLEITMGRTPEPWKYSAPPPQPAPIPMPTTARQQDPRPQENQSAEVSRPMPESEVGWLRLPRVLPEEYKRYPQVDNPPLQHRAKNIKARGQVDPATGRALPSPTNPRHPATTLTPEQICLIAEIGLKSEMNKYGEVFLTTGTRCFQIREEYAWVLLIPKQVNGEWMFPLSRHRLARVFPEYEMVFRGERREASAREVQARTQKRTSQGKFQISAKKQARRDDQARMESEICSLRDVIRQMERDKRSRDNAQQAQQAQDKRRRAQDEALMKVVENFTDYVNVLRDQVGLAPVAAAIDPVMPVPSPAAFATPALNRSRSEDPTATTADPLSMFVETPQQLNARLQRQRAMAAANPFQASPERDPTTTTADPFSMFVETPQELNTRLRRQRSMAAANPFRASPERASLVRAESAVRSLSSGSESVFALVEEITAHRRESVAAMVPTSSRASVAASTGEVAPTHGRKRVQETLERSPRRLHPRRSTRDP